jgi:hypothetical protein
MFGAENNEFTFDMLNVPLLEDIHQYITGAQSCRLRHPSGKTLVSWLDEIGFKNVLPSHNGADFAESFFDKLSDENRPEDIESIDALLRPVIDVAVTLPAPIETDPMITATK